MTHPLPEPEASPVNRAIDRLLQPVPGTATAWLSSNRDVFARWRAEDAKTETRR